MATVTILRRATGKAHTVSVLDADQAILGGLVRSTAGVGNLYNDANTTSVNLGTGASVGTVTIGATGTKTVVSGDLVVRGTATSVDSEIVNIADNDLYLNAGYTAAVAQSGGLVVNYLPIAPTDSVAATGFVAGVAATSNPTVFTSGYTTVAGASVGDVIPGTAGGAGVGVIAVASTAGFPASGTIYVNTSTGIQLVTYTGKSPTTFTGCTGGDATGLMSGAVTRIDWAAGQFIQLSDTNNPENSGVFEVLSYVAGLLTIRGVGTVATVEAFSQNQFVTDTTVAGTITRINVSVMRSGTDGIWEMAKGSSSGLVFADVASAAGTTLQVAYDNSTGPATITTNATDQEVLITGTAGLRVTGSGADNSTSVGYGFEVDTTGAFRMLADATSDLSVAGAGADLTLSSVGGSVYLDGSEAVVDAIKITASDAAGGIDINAGTGGITLDTTAGFSLDAATTSNVSVSGATADLVFGARGNASAITLNEAGQVTLDGTFVATSIIGALNELKTGLSTYAVTDYYITTGRTIGEVVIGDGNGSAATAALSDVLADVEGLVGIVLTVGGASTGQVITQGRAVAKFEAGSARPVAGDPLYVSLTEAGTITGTAPTGAPGSGVVVYQVGIMKDNTGLSATVLSGETAKILVQPMQLFVI